MINTEQEQATIPPMYFGSLNLLVTILKARVSLIDPVLSAHALEHLAQAEKLLQNILQNTSSYNEGRIYIHSSGSLRGDSSSIPNPINTDLQSGTPLRQLIASMYVQAHCQLGNHNVAIDVLLRSLGPFLNPSAESLEMYASSAHQQSTQTSEKVHSCPFTQRAAWPSWALRHLARINVERGCVHAALVWADCAYEAKQRESGAYQDSAISPEYQQSLDRYSYYEDRAAIYSLARSTVDSTYPGYVNFPGAEHVYHHLALTAQVTQPTYLFALRWLECKLRKCLLSQTEYRDLTCEIENINDSDDSLPQYQPIQGKGEEAPKRKLCLRTQLPPIQVLQGLLENLANESTDLIHKAMASLLVYTKVDRSSKQHCLGRDLARSHIADIFLFIHMCLAVE
ncbi:hypothetical protein BASA83_007801 [Batrachochytrium salamandrivorans]|nr:hypothetical protein BASA83_007801 [Batrachochytrium salamandrivorans]